MTEFESMMSLVSPTDAQDPGIEDVTPMTSLLAPDEDAVVTDEKKALSPFPGYGGIKVETRILNSFPPNEFCVVVLTRMTEGEVKQAVSNTMKWKRKILAAVKRKELLEKKRKMLARKQEKEMEELVKELDKLKKMRTVKRKKVPIVLVEPRVSVCEFADGSGCGKRFWNQAAMLTHYLFDHFEAIRWTADELLPIYECAASSACRYATPSVNKMYIHTFVHTRERMNIDSYVPAIISDGYVFDVKVEDK